MTPDQIVEAAAKSLRNNLDLSEELLDDLDLHATARALLPLFEQVRGESWMPIETAPKDGTVILAFSRHYHTGEPWVHETMWNGAHWYHGYGDGWPSNPTHFMPLPTPPSDQKG